MHQNISLIINQHFLFRILFKKNNENCHSSLNSHGPHSPQGYHSSYFKRDATGGPPTPQHTAPPNKQDFILLVRKLT